MTNSPNTTVIDNANQPLGDLLLAEMRGADEFRAVSAFLSSGGLRIVEGEMRRILENEGRVSVIHGADFRITDPAAIDTLADLKTRFSATMTYLVHMDWNLLRRPRFHPKMYLATADYQRYCAVIGSSNLTLGGLRDNAEVNVTLRGNWDDAPIRQCLDIFDSIVRGTALLEPDKGFAEKYAILYREAANLPLEDLPPSGLEDLYAELEALQLPGGRAVHAPSTQLDYAVLAVANLTDGERGVYVHLSAIYAEASRLARRAGEDYVWSTFSNSVRGRINANVDGNGKDFFQRSDTTPGVYRLTDKGRAYGRRFSG